MFDWLKTKTLCKGGVLFRGSLPPRPEDFAGLTGQGIRVTKREVGEGSRWALSLTHPEWGKAELLCHRNTAPPPRMVLEWASGISDSEREAALQAGCQLLLAMPGTRNHALRDRKAFLRFLGAVMGSDGLAAFDYLALKLWTRTSLDEELSHDADLDISQIMEFHAVVREEGGTRLWLHSHGLAEIGFFDFDILNPARELGNIASDALRALAFAIVEETVTLSTRNFTAAMPGGDIRMVAVEEFNRLAKPTFVEIRDSEDPSHNQKRAVVCEPAGWLLGRSRPRPSKFFSRPIPDGSMYNLSVATTQLAAERAIKTMGMFKRFLAELEPFHFPALVKLGYPTDVDPAGHEHLWFEVHELGDSAVDATLANEPVHVSKLKAGRRDWYSLELLSDWTIMTPFGPVTPRSTTIVRTLDKHREKLLAAMRKGQGD